MEDEEDVLFLDPDSDFVRPSNKMDCGCLLAIVGGLIAGIVYLMYQNQ